MCPKNSTPPPPPSPPPPQKERMMGKMDFSSSSSSSFPTTIEKRRRVVACVVLALMAMACGVVAIVFALSGVSLVSSNRPDVEKSFTSFWGRRIRGGFFMAEEEGDDAWDGPVPEPTYEEGGNDQNKEEEEEEEKKRRKYIRFVSLSLSLSQSIARSQSLNLFLVRTTCSRAREKMSR